MTSQNSDKPQETLYTAGMVENRVRAARKDEREKVLNELLLPVESAIGEASDNGDYVVQACFNDCKNWIEQARGRS